MRKYFDPRVAQARAINERQQRDAGFKSVDDYEKDESIDVIDPRDGEYISVTVIGTYTECDGVRGLRVATHDGRSFDCPLWTVKGQ